MQNPNQITLIPMEEVPQELLDYLLEKLPRPSRRLVTLGNELSLPTRGYDARRGQHLGDAILVALHELPNPGQVIGLVDSDCYAVGLNFIFGQASVGGREAFVALPRLRESFYGRSGNPPLFCQRVLKEVLHELGHTLGLHHCPDPHCVMHFSNSLQDTDFKNAEFCPKCQDKL